MVFCSFTHLRRPRSPPKINQFFIVPPWGPSIRFHPNLLITFWVMLSTNKQTGRQTNTTRNKPPFAKEVISINPDWLLRFQYSWQCSLDHPTSKRWTAWESRDCKVHQPAFSSRSPFTDLPTWPNLFQEWYRIVSGVHMLAHTNTNATGLPTWNRDLAYLKLQKSVFFHFLEYYLISTYFLTILWVCVMPATMLFFVSFPILLIYDNMLMLRFWRSLPVPFTI